MTATESEHAGASLSAAGAPGTSTSQAKLPFDTIVAYSMPSLVLGFSSSLVSLYILKFATDVMLIPPALFATVYAIARVWDGVSDPIVGYLSDRTHTKSGRRRPWIAGGAIPLAALTVILWSPPASLTGTPALVWITVSITLFYTCYTVIAVPHLALGAEMTTDYHDRSRVFGGRGILDFGGTLLAALAIWLFQSADDPRAAARLVAVAFAALSIPILWLSVARIVERPDYQGRGSHAPIAAIKDIARNKYSRILITVFFLENVSLSFIATLFPFVTQYILPNETRASGGFLTFAMVVTLISFPMWFPLSRRFGKRNTWIAANVLKVIAFSSLYFTTPQTLWLGYFALICIGMSLSAHVILAPSVKADVVDYDELETGERKEGAYFAAWNLVQKLAGALAVVFSGYLLQFSGYEANIEQSEAALTLMRTLFAGLPFALHIIVIVLLLRFSLNEVEHSKIRRAIDARNALASQKNQ